MPERRGIGAHAVLAIIVALFVLQPLTSESLFGVRLTQVFYGAVFFGVLATVIRSRRLLGLGVAIVLLTMFLPGLDFDAPEPNQAIGATLAIAFMVWALIAFVWQVFQADRVTSATISASIAVYLLMGLLWASIYRLLLWTDASSFAGLSSAVGAGPDLFYFSFVTQTTLGFGDIVPRSHAARAATTLQAIAGQIYLVVLIARLVSLHAASRLRN